MAAGDHTVASGVMATDLSREERLLKRSAAAVEEEDEASAEPNAKRLNTGAEPSGAGRARAGQGAAVASDDHAEGAKGVETGAGEGGAGVNVGATATAAPDEEQPKQAVVGAQATASEAVGDKADACGASQRPPAPASSSGAGASAPEAPAVPAIQNQNVRGAYAQREEFLLGLETSGEVVFQGIRNDGKLDTLKMLLAAKNIYSKQLPNMPREYIVKLVFDPTHRTIIVRKPSSHANNAKTNANGDTAGASSGKVKDDMNCPNSNVVGGITYRSFTKEGRRFGEIAFCAVLASQQVRGYGTRLMNHAKEYAKCEEGGGLTHFLTYADNAAVGYFAKQGFTKEITLDKELWQGYIKDYDGGTLMECILRHEMSYTDFPKVIRKQRAALDNVVRTLSNAHVVRPGIFDADGKRTYEGSDPMRIPGVEKAGYKRQEPTYGLIISRSGAGGKKLLPAGEPPTEHNLQRFMLQVLETVRQHDCSWPFVEKVPIAEVPDYYDVVKDPIDLSTIEEKVSAGGYYVTLEIFAADFKRMFNNCRTYNAPDTIYFKLANKLEELFESCIRAGIQKYS